MAEIEQRLAAIEARLEKMESWLGFKPEMTPEGKPSAAAPSMPQATSPAVSKPAVTPEAPERVEQEGPSFATKLLGWGGATALMRACCPRAAWSSSFYPSMARIFTTRSSAHRLHYPPCS